jgi:hypothetical protein
LRENDLSSAFEGKGIKKREIKKTNKKNIFRMVMYQYSLPQGEDVISPIMVSLGEWEVLEK